MVPVWDGAHPQWPKIDCFTLRLWPIDCLPEKSEFRMRTSEWDSKVTQHEAGAPESCNIPPPWLIPQFSFGSLHLYMYIWFNTELSFTSAPFSLFTEKLIIFIAICITPVFIVNSTLWPPGKDVMLTWCWNEMPLLYTTPFALLAIFPVDGLSSNPQTLCTCVSISSVAWRPFYPPYPGGNPRTHHGGDQVNIILVRETTFLIYWKAV